MKVIAKAISAAGLLLTVVPAYLVWAGSVTWDMHAMYMLLGTLLWFCSAPFWMKKAEA